MFSYRSPLFGGFDVRCRPEFEPARKINSATREIFRITQGQQYSQLFPEESRPLLECAEGNVRSRERARGNRRRRELASIVASHTAEAFRETQASDFRHNNARAIHSARLRLDRHTDRKGAMRDHIAPTQG